MKVLALAYRGFTLAEILVSLAILGFIMLMLSSFLGAVSRAWLTGEQQVPTFQDGRAILDLVGRELAHAGINSSLQFVTNPTIAGARTNSDSIFWEAPLTYRIAGSSSPLTNLCEVGYYLAQDNTQTGANIYQLRRFFAQPADTKNYQIYASAPSDTTALWVTNYVGNTGVSTTIATGVVGFWVRCLDSNGDVVSWLSTFNGASTLHFDSAAHFEPAFPSQAAWFPTGPGVPSFKYTASSTAQANLLPNAVELTLVIVDARAFTRNPVIPGMPPDASDPSSPAVNSPSAVPAAITYFNNKLISNHVSSARTFTIRVPLENALR